MASKPTFEQAQLQMQIYEQRREPRLREARDWFFKNFFADSMDEAMRIAAPMSEEGKYWSMVVSYWEQACAMLDYGLLHEDLFFETNAEFFGVWERMRPMIAEGRKRFSNNRFLYHMEQAAQKYEKWAENHSPGHVSAMREWGKQMRQQMGKAA
ncbi:MAG TPA: hypothetical protein VMU24_08345 [Candidatus Acidoferrales bacterium]|nr:hypothetical protein [Candidatus Acidoferrales bacterium]